MKFNNAGHSISILKLPSCQNMMLFLHVCELKMLTCGANVVYHIYSVCLLF